MQDNRLYVLYTEEEGGDFHYVAKNTDEETKQLYEDTVKTGRLLYTIGDRVINIRPAYICLGKDIDGYDFVLKRRRIGTKLLDDKEGEEKNDQ